MRCALFLRVKILQRVGRSRLKCTQVRWQISWCAWFYFYKRHIMRFGILIHCGNWQGVPLSSGFPQLVYYLNLLNVFSIWTMGVLFKLNNFMWKNTGFGLLNNYIWKVFDCRRDLGRLKHLGKYQDLKLLEDFHVFKKCILNKNWFPSLRFLWSIWN